MSCQNPAAFWGVAVTDSMMSINVTLWAFKLFPTIAFCTSAEDACSCKGGGFEVYAAFCNVTSMGAVDEGNLTLSPSNDTTAATNMLALVRAKEEYPGYSRYLWLFL